MNDSCLHNSSKARLSWRFLVVLMIAGTVFLWAYWNVQLELNSPKVSILDVDGWGHFVSVFKSQGFNLSLLWQLPTVWKGPVVPTIFGLCYYIFPHDHSILYLSCLCAALAAALHFLAFVRLGIPIMPVAAGILCAFVFIPHRFLYGYYFAEPVITLISGTLFWFFVRVPKEVSPLCCILLGLLAGVLLLARSPFALTVLLIGALLGYQSKSGKLLKISLYLAGVVVIVVLWGFRNFATEGAFIPFTAESGKVLFQGTYIPADDIRQADLRKREDYRALEAQEGENLIERDQYWKALAKANVLGDPIGQVVLCVKKALRFWMQIPPYSWVPSIKSGLMFLVVAPLFYVGIQKLSETRDRLLILSWVLGVWGFHSLIHSEFRYNFPVLPFVFVVATFGLERSIRSFIVKAN